MFLICPATNFLEDGGSAAAARPRQRGDSWQCGGSVGSAAVVAAERWQRGDSVAVVAVRRQRGGGQRGSTAAGRRRWQHDCGSLLGGCDGS
jgi:hypothetical protein